MSDFYTIMFTFYTFDFCYLTYAKRLFKSFPYQAEEQDLSEILTIGKTDISHHLALASRYSTKFGQFLQSLI
jgi:hypothetical protein